MILFFFEIADNAFKSATSPNGLEGVSSKNNLVFSWMLYSQALVLDKSAKVTLISNFLIMLFKRTIVVPNISRDATI